MKAARERSLALHDLPTFDLTGEASDAVGNRTQVTDHDVPASCAATTLNQYASAGAAIFGYDLDGTLTNQFSTRFTYDSENPLLGVMNEANGLEFMRARFCRAQSGRFVQADPRGIVTGAKFHASAWNFAPSLVDPPGLVGSTDNTLGRSLSPGCADYERPPRSIDPLRIRDESDALRLVFDTAALRLAPCRRGVRSSRYCFTSP